MALYGSCHNFVFHKPFQNCLKSNSNEFIFRTLSFSLSLSLDMTAKFFLWGCPGWGHKKIWIAKKLSFWTCFTQMWLKKNQKTYIERFYRHFFVFRKNVKKFSKIENLILSKLSELDVVTCKDNNMKFLKIFKKGLSDFKSLLALWTVWSDAHVILTARVCP